MQIEVIRQDDSSELVEAPDECMIGKGFDCDIRLNTWRIGRQHARIFNSPSGVFVEDLGAFGGVLVNGQRITLQQGPLSTLDQISIGPYRLRVASSQAAAPGRAPVDGGGITQGRLWTRRASDHVHGHQLTRDDIKGAVEHGRRAADTALRQSGADVSALAAAQRAAPRTAVPAVRQTAALTDPQAQALQGLEFEWRKRLHGLLLEAMDLRRRDISTMTDERLRNEASLLMDNVMQSIASELPPQLSPVLLRKQVIDEAVGLGPLEELLADDSISEIMVNRFDSIFVERRGQLHAYPSGFTSERAVISVIERIVAPLGRHIDESTPMVDARLKDGSRVNAIIPPLAIHGAAVTIRKFPKHKLTSDDLVRLESISPEMLEFLRICVESRKNIVISGGTGSGKTSLLNILSNFIPDGERIITVEDAAELSLKHAHIISLEARPANAEGKGKVTIRDLVKNVLRMRPDRVVIGECRGAESLDMLQAMNTGHEGSLTTLHANAPRDAMARLETMVLMAGADLPLSAIREQIASAVHIIVQQTRFACGSRVVTNITELSGIESGRFQLQDLFVFKHRGYHPDNHPQARKVNGHFSGCDAVPGFYEELALQGNPLNLRIFVPVGEDGLPVHSSSGYTEQRSEALQ